MLGLLPQSTETAPSINPLHLQTTHDQNITQTKDQYTETKDLRG